MWIIDFFLPPKDCTDVNDMRQWHYKIAGGFILIIAVASFAMFTPWGVVFAGDVDKKISRALEPMAKKQEAMAKTQGEQGQQLDAISKLLKDNLAAGLASQIRLNVSKNCKTSGYVEREELARERDRLQDQYNVYKGYFYREPTCSEL